MNASMTDPFGRTINYLRLSVTERCNLRCAYCMPAEGGCEREHAELCLEELAELAAACVSLGVKKIRLTGGEPLLRRDILALVERLHALRQDGLEELCMTTNGSLLADYAAPLRAAGLDRLNISLDTLRPARYRALTRGGDLNRVLDGIAAAEAAGFRDIRLNAVLLRGVNDDELADLARLAETHPWSVRMIELMPIGPGAEMPDAFLPASRVLEAVPELGEMHLEPPVTRHQSPGDGGRGFFAALRMTEGERAVGAAGGRPQNATVSEMQNVGSDTRQQATGNRGREACTVGAAGGRLQSGTGNPSPTSVARLYTAPGWTGTVGLITPMSCDFCAACSRIRITADGKLKLCLHAAEELPLRGLHGAALTETIAAAVRRKPARHRLSGSTPSDSARPMNEIGG